LNNSITNYKNTNFVMKGEMKVISNNISNLDSKNFKINIMEPKESEGPTKLLRQTKGVPQVTNNQENINKMMRGQHKSEESANNYAQLLMTADNNVESENQTQKIKNPFDLLEEILTKKMQSEYEEEFQKIKFGNKFIYDFFKHVSIISQELLETVLVEINNMIEEFFNILSEQVNEYINLFLSIYSAYINREIVDEKKFKIIHEALGSFFIKSLKNKSEEMFFIFKNVFLSKIFDTMSNPEYKDRLVYFCQLLYRVLDPNDNQQIDLFKLAKENIKIDVILYATFSNFHDSIQNYSENLIDGCLFFILNGIAHCNPEIRYHSLYMLNKYVGCNTNFFCNFERKLERLSNKERDRESCLIIIKMAIKYLKSVYLIKNEVKENSGNQIIIKKRVSIVNGEKEEIDLVQNLGSEQIANRIIKNILNRFLGDNLIMLLSTLSISEGLFENVELHKIVISSLFNCNESILKYIFYDEPLDDNLSYILRFTPCRHEPVLVKGKDWNFPIFFKAYDIYLKENLIQQLTDKDYKFINFLLKNDINVLYTELYKSHFRFAHLIIKDMRSFEKCLNCINIVQKFILCETLSKFIFDDIFEDFQSLLRDLVDDNREEAKKTRELIVTTLKYWNNNAALIIRDGIKKLLDILS
jgi:hypothetical protein